MNSDRAWFTARTYDSVSIRKRKVWASSARSEKPVTIYDRKVIDSLVENISSLPTDRSGTIQISWGPGAEVLEATFHSEAGDTLIEFYNGRIKTPGTGFLAQATEQEAAVYRDVRRHIGLIAALKRLFRPR